VGERHAAAARLSASPGSAAAVPAGRTKSVSNLPAMSEPDGGPAVVVRQSPSVPEAEVSTSDFGRIPEEVSSLESMPEDLRKRASEAAGQPSAVGTGRLVLVVDDDEDIRKLLQRMLTQKGLRVMEADRGLLALRLVKDNVPDIIILDAMLPEIHGFDIARRIKGSAKYGATPIIMMSAVYKGWRIAEDLKANYGVEAFLEKPFRVAQVLELVLGLVAKLEGQQVPERDPEHLSEAAETALNEGIAAYKAGNIEPAIEHLKRGVSIDPLAYRLHFHLALLYGKKGSVYEAITELERAIDLNPRHFPALKNLAVLYEKAGFKNKGVEMWERCVAAAPDEPTRASVREHLLSLI
jgi:DNA-binding response OmpR family regulator